MSRHERESSLTQQKSNDSFENKILINANGASLILVISRVSYKIFFYNNNK